jgi:hypothetical protein
MARKVWVFPPEALVSLLLQPVKARDVVFESIIKEKINNIRIKGEEVF